MSQVQNTTVPQEVTEVQKEEKSNVNKEKELKDIDTIAGSLMDTMLQRY
jgi:hypothetical protein